MNNNVNLDLGPSVIFFGVWTVLSWLSWLTLLSSGSPCIFTLEQEECTEDCCMIREWGKVVEVGNVKRKPT